MGERAAIYARKSTGKESDNRSIDEQIKAAEAFAADQGWEVAPAHVFKEVVSGKNLKDRKQMQRLIMAIQNGQIQHVVCWKADRRARNFKEAGWLDVEATEYGVTWHFVERGIVPENLTNENARYLIESMAAFTDATERETIVGRLQWGHDNRLRAGGLKTGPKPPYGWERQDFIGADGKIVKSGTLRQKPEEAPVVEKMFRMLVEDRASIAEVTRWLQTSGHPTPMGKPSSHWSEMSLKTIVRHPCHMGLAVTNRTQGVPGTSGSRHRSEDEWEILENAPPLKPIVSEATWRAANDALAENRRRSGGTKSPDNLGLLSYGHIFGVCPKGHRHALGWRGGRYKMGSKQRGAPKCPIITISADPIDESVWGQVAELLNNPVVLLKRLKSQTSGDGMAEELELAEAAVAKLETKVKNLWATIEDAKTDAARRQASERLDEFAPALEAAEMERRSIAARAQAFTSQVDILENFFENLRADKERLAALNLEGRRAVMRQLDVQVLVRPDEKKGMAARWRGTIGIMPPRRLGPSEVLPDGYDPTGIWLGDDLEDDNRWEDVDWEYDPWDDAVDDGAPPRGPRLVAREHSRDTWTTGEQSAPRRNSQSTPT